MLSNGHPSRPHADFINRFAVAVALLHGPSWTTFMPFTWTAVDLAVAPLLGPQRDDRIDGSSTTSGDPAGRKGREDEEASRAEECGDVGWRNAIEKRCEQAGDADRENGANSDADDREEESLAEHEPEDTPALGAERDPDTDFAGALGDAVRGNAVDPEEREQQRDDAEASCSPQGDPLREERERHVRIERGLVEDRKRCVEASDEPAERCGGNAAGRAHDQRHAGVVALGERDIDEVARLLSERAGLR